MNSNSEKQPKPNESKRSPYIHWIHCNICYELYMHKRRSFYLLACEHLICQQCSIEVQETEVNAPKIFKCPLCRQQTRACKMGNAMPSNLKELFHPEPYLDGLNTHRIMLFQEKHHRRFLDYMNRDYAALKDYENCTQKDRELAKKHYEDLEIAKAERKRLEKRAIIVKNQRKEMEEKRHSRNSSNNSVSNSSSSLLGKATMTRTGSSPKIPLQGPRMPKPVLNSGITQFSQCTPNNSFIL